MKFDIFNSTDQRAFHPSAAAKWGIRAAVILGDIETMLTVRVDGVTVLEADGVRWVGVSYDVMSKRLPFLSRSTIRRTVGRLERLGALISRTGLDGNPSRPNHKWYSLNMEVIKE